MISTPALMATVARPALTLALLGALGLSLLPTHAAARPGTPAAPRVVNGVSGPSPEFDALVALGDRARYRQLGMDRAHFCGGALASPTLVITAAHCVLETPARSIVVGSYPDGNLTSRSGRVVDVAAVKINPAYRPDTQAGDIAVLTLAEPLLGVPTLTPAIGREARVLTAAGAPVSVAGWGAINHRQPWRYASTYRIGRLVVFPTASCGGGEPYTIDGVEFVGYGPGAVKSRVMLCAEGVRSGEPIDSCVGDSGGPLIGGTGADRRLVGIVSWGLNRCATPRGAGVYTRVSALTDFLVSAGVPFTPDPVDIPLPPTITKVTTTTRSITVTMTPSGRGLAPDEYVASARDSQGGITSCTVAAPARPTPARCTISGLVTAEEYVVSAIAVSGGTASVAGEAQIVVPAGMPSRPRIVDARAEPRGVAGFVVHNIRGNGSPLTDKRVRCTADGHPARSGPIREQGIALVSRLSRGTTYACVAIVTNAYGTATSTKARITAR